MKIYFVRHGESTANLAHIISNRDLPHALTPRGREQAGALAARLSATRFEQVFASPILRARQTGEILANRLAAPLEIFPALREYDCGALEGRGDEPAWATHREFFRAWLSGARRGEAPAGGETFFDIQSRFHTFCAELIHTFGGTSANLLCISHGGTLRLALPGLLTNVDFAFSAAHAPDYTDVICAEARPAGLACLHWGPIHFETENMP